MYPKIIGGSDVLIKNPTNSKVINGIIRALDQEFIYNKGKTVGLKIRYPKLFDKKNYKNLFYAELNGEVVSFLAVKKLDVKSGKTGVPIRLFLIGCVFTPEKHRGNGFSSLLLKHVSTHYFKQKFDAGFLWTTQQDFYARLGWVENENGQFILLRSLLKAKHHKKKSDGNVTLELDKPISHSKLNAFRTLHNKTTSTVRKLNMSDSYQTIPSPATNTKILLAKKSNPSTIVGYCVVGFQSQNVYVYEIEPATKTLLSKMVTYIASIPKIENVYLNLPESIKFPEVYASLAKEVEIRSQRLTMILSKDKATLRSLKSLYIPFIDRI